MNTLCRTISLSFVLVWAGAAMGQTAPPAWVPVPMELPAGIRNALPTGQKPLTDTLHISVALPFGNPIGMQSFVNSVSDPKSPTYRQYITPGEVGARFGLSAASVKKVTDYLSSYGMHVRLVGQNRLSVLADATVAQAQAAFNTSIEEFFPLTTVPVAGKSFFSFTTPPNVPVAISSYVGYIGGLENFTRPKAHTALTPNQLRTLYSLASLYGSGTQGQGRTVAISNFDGYSLSNVPLEFAHFNLPTPSGGVGANISVVSINGQNGQNDTPNGEGDLDIQTVLAMAPLCNFIVYDDGGNQDDDLIGVLTKEADDNKADIISESYGWSADSGFYLSAHNLHLSMNAQGITYMAASGDTGTTTLQGSQPVPYPDMDPEVLLVGGTSVTTDGSGNRSFEQGWNGSGGGWYVSTDAFNVLPTWQKGFGVPTNIPYRLVPDVALNADDVVSPYEIYIDGILFTTIGGTSCASPTFAGSLADCEQQIIAGGGLTANGAGKQRFGRIQDLLYSYNGDSSVFFDITQGSNGNLPNGQASNAGQGWDTVTGWGCMIFSGFVSKVVNLHVPSVLSLTPSTVVGGNSSQGLITISSAAPDGGLAINLTSASASASMPPVVTVAAGATSATFTITTTSVASQTNDSISVSAGGVTVRSTLTINPPALTGLSVSPVTVIGGNVTNGTVGISGTAPVGGLTIKLSSSSSNAKVPASVTIPEGATVGSFTVNTNAVSTASQATISAVFGNSSESTILAIQPASLAGVSVSPSSVMGATTAIGTVSLNGTAPTGGLTVNLKSNTPNATVLASAKVPAGAASVNFTVSTKAVSANFTATITATRGTISETTTLTILPPTLVKVIIAPVSVVGGSTTAVTGTVTLSAAAPASGISVSLASLNSAVATVAPSVKVLGGSKTAKFAVKTKSVATTTSASISATLGSTSQQGALTVTPPALVSIAVRPGSVKGSALTTVTGSVTINVGAPVGGLVVSLSSSNASAASLPEAITIPAGKTSATFAVSHSTVATPTTVSLTASLSGGSKTAKLTVTH